MTRTPYESATALTSHNAADPAELNVVCCSKPNLLNQTDSNGTLLPYLTHQLGSAHEWSGVWNGPYMAGSMREKDEVNPVKILIGYPSLSCSSEISSA